MKLFGIDEMIEIPHMRNRFVFAHKHKAGDTCL